jgi:dipeptidyl aminopeptidase/acylaminoacyl peptidase
MSLSRLLLILSCVSIPLGGVHAQAKEPFTVEHLVRLKRVSEPAVSPDGSRVVFTVRETDIEANRGRQDLWLLDLATKGAQPQPLTTHLENDNSPQWSPDGAYVYFLSSRSGSSQVWRQPANGGDAEQVTDLPLDVGTFRLSPNGAHIAFSLEVFPDCDELACTKTRLDQTKGSRATGMTFDRIFVRHWDTWSDGRISQLFIAQLDNGRAQEPRSLTRALDADVPSKPFGDASEYVFSPDSTKIAFNARIKGKSEPWSTNFDIFEIGIDGSGLRNLTEDNPAWDAQPVYSPKGTHLAWRAMKRPGFEADRFHVVVLDLKTGERTALTDAWDRSVDHIEFSNDGRTLYGVTDHFGQRPLWAIDLKTGKPTMLTGPGRVESFSVGPKEIVFSLASLKSPAELYTVSPRNRDLRELPKINGEQMAQLALGEPTQYTFAGAHGETVYAYAMTPANFDAKKRYPVAFIVHGGPQVSFGNAWSYRWNPQTYAGAGYATIFIDFHGSPGYGQAFTDSISGDWGGKPLEDLQKGLAAALEKFSWLDGDRMCALGASYGGYMINWIAGNWSEPFKCLVNHAGIFDSRSMAYTTEELWFDEWEHGGPAYEVPEAFEKHNPINRVTEWKTPMLVIHGQRDYRVPYSQGIATFTALQRLGIPSRLVIYPDENHWILKPANSVQWHNEVKTWLDQWMGKAK